MLATTGKSALRAFDELSLKRIGALAPQAREAHREIVHAYGESAVGRTHDPIGNRESTTEGTATKSYVSNGLNQYDEVDSGGTVANLQHDEDGNLLNDGTKLLTYNAENQLVRVEVPGQSISTFAYDYIGRRVQKNVDVLDSSGDDYAVTWVYSGWSKLEERKTVGAVTTVKNFVWGLDLSQSMEGAGGVGGLIAVVGDDGSSNLFAYNGNGDVSELIAADSGSVSAHYEYDAFGNTVLATGALATDNHWRFSTKQIDPESGLYYYGYRDYEAGLGRWTSRDPIGELGRRGIIQRIEEREQGGLSLEDIQSVYVFANNGPISATDGLGLKVEIRGWGLFHAIIKIEGKCTDRYDGSWSFGPPFAMESLPSAVAWLAGYWVHGDIEGPRDEPLPGEIRFWTIEDDADFEKRLYERMARDQENPPCYSWSLYNCWDWVENMLSGRHPMNRYLADLARDTGACVGAP